ncbi:RNA-binding protein 33-like [Helianthus annuus]|uniref:RNA-binding protein 33-like n=1 Tax=Helianthus annuus TaxID=4232 RepID=UPI000B90581B|nr:RNA-binding protein 33-like [Helianthus annuus]
MASIAAIEVESAVLQPTPGGIDPSVKKSMSNPDDLGIIPPVSFSTPSKSPCTTNSMFVEVPTPVKILNFDDMGNLEDGGWVSEEEEVVEGQDSPHQPENMDDMATVPPPSPTTTTTTICHHLILHRPPATATTRNPPAINTPSTITTNNTHRPTPTIYHRPPTSYHHHHHNHFVAAHPNPNRTPTNTQKFQPFNWKLPSQVVIHKWRA